VYQTAGREGDYRQRRIFLSEIKQEFDTKTGSFYIQKKDSVEKIINSLKNEIEIKPLRVWTDASIYGAVIIGFIAQLFISLMRYEYDELKSKSTKFIKNSLLNLTVTVDYMKNKAKRDEIVEVDVNYLILSNGFS
jgi:transposase